MPDDIDITGDEKSISPEYSMESEEQKPAAQPTSKTQPTSESQPTSNEYDSNVMTTEPDSVYDFEGSRKT